MDDFCLTVTFSPAMRRFLLRSSSLDREPLMPMAAKRYRQKSAAFGKGSELRTGRLIISSAGPATRGQEDKRGRVNSNCASILVSTAANRQRTAAHLLNI